jgi:quercetin dioxygenase-like cupin family protein
MTPTTPDDRLQPARALRIAELARVSEAATLSRVLVRSAGGSVTLFAFAAGQELSEHTAPFDALVHVLEGRLELRIGGASVRAGAGEIVLMPAGVPHALVAPEDTKMLLTMLREKGKD